MVILGPTKVYIGIQRRHAYLYGGCLGSVARAPFHQLRCPHELWLCTSCNWRQMRAPRWPIKGFFKGNISMISYTACEVVGVAKVDRRDVYENKKQRDGT